ncbi:MAG: hypothetical protein FJ117_20365 [Deltaproteobacteria bacterium]|nr:hypothetical protein [Deltaproteobacteria bacterium]
MFYEVKVPEPKSGQKQISALVVLNPAESRRLLAKATVALPEVRNAWENGMIIIGRGITNAYVTEELFNITIEPKAGQTAGLISKGITNNHAAPPVCTWHVIRKGKVVEGADSNVEILNFGPEDVFIKGANAIDSRGNAGIFASSLKGGTIGMCWPIVTSRGSHLIMPVGLEKLIPCVSEAARNTGIYHFKYSTGLPAKLMPVESGKVVTEIQAFALLTGVRACHVASGGVGGSEGAVVFSLTGDEEKIEKAMALVKSIKGEPPVTLPDKFSLSSPVDYNYDAMAQHATLKGI